MGRIALFGSTDITVAVAEAILRAGHAIASITHVPRPFEISYSDKPVAISRQADVAQWCAAHAIPAIEYAGVDKSVEHFRSNPADLCVVAGWYHMLPSRLRDLFRLGAVGLHASRLPELRGGAPLNWAILAGFERTAVTLFALGDGVDDGPVYGQEAIDVGPNDYIGELVARCNAASVVLVERCISGILDGSLVPAVQDGVASYGAQRSPEDGAIDWAAPAASIARLVRAVSRPYPGASTWLDGRLVRIWRAGEYRAAAVYGGPGQILCLPGGQVVVATGKGAVEIEEAEDDGGQSVMAALRRSSHRRFRSQS